MGWRKIDFTTARSAGACSLGTALATLREVHLAALPGRTGEGEGAAQTLVGVRDDQLHAAEPTSREAAAERQPEGLGLAGTHRQPEHALLAAVPHTHRHHRGQAHDPATKPSRHSHASEPSSAIVSGWCPYECATARSPTGLPVAARSCSECGQCVPSGFARATTSAKRPGGCPVERRSSGGVAAPLVPTRVRTRRACGSTPATTRLRRGPSALGRESGSSPSGTRVRGRSSSTCGTQFRHPERTC